MNKRKLSFEIILVCVMIFLSACKKTDNEEKTEELITEVIIATQPDANESYATGVDADPVDGYSIDISKQPAELTGMLEKSGYTYEELSERECTQLILVCANGNEAKVYMYEHRDGIWTDAGCNCDGHVGLNGASRDSYEGSKMTPVGMFSIGDGFYIENEPETGLDTFQITENTYWVDDPESDLYNTRVELEGEKTFNSAEHMISYTEAYKYGFVINFNMDPVVKGKGSAIFFHIGNNSTAGCVSVSQDSLLRIMKLLEKDKNPHIIIFNG